VTPPPPLRVTPSVAMRPNYFLIGIEAGERPRRAASQPTSQGAARRARRAATSPAPAAVAAAPPSVSGAPSAPSKTPRTRAPHARAS
jgi:hypothetical protein